MVAPYEPRVPHGWVNPGDKEVQVPHEWVNPGPGGAPAFFCFCALGKEKKPLAVSYADEESKAGDGRDGPAASRAVLISKRRQGRQDRGPTHLHGQTSRAQAGILLMNKRTRRQARGQTRSRPVALL